MAADDGFHITDKDRRQVDRKQFTDKIGLGKDEIDEVAAANEGQSVKVDEIRQSVRRLAGEDDQPEK